MNGVRGAKRDCYEVTILQNVGLKLNFKACSCDLPAVRSLAIIRFWRHAMKRFKTRTIEKSVGYVIDLPSLET
jgi:hypothetical protein